MTAPDIRYIERAPQRIAYRLRPGATPTLVFLSGYASDMEGTKALALDGFAAGRGQAYLPLRLFRDGRIWRPLRRSDPRPIDRRNQLEVLDGLTEGPIVLIGSSMGAWISFHVAQRRPKRVQGLRRPGGGARLHRMGLRS